MSRFTIDHSYAIIISVLSIVLFPCCLLAQSTVIHGSVKNIQKEIIPFATVVIQANEVLGYTSTDKQGNYRLPVNIPADGQVTITVSSLGYKSVTKVIENKNQERLEISFELKEKAEQLQEVVLEAWEKIKVDKDTVTFRASAFMDGSEQVLEDLLKNLPGVEIAPDGGIKVGGKSIEKLLIEGEDLLGSRYAILSKNLDVHNIEDIQILNNYEDNPILKEFRESEKIALNIRLREDKKNVWFGNINLGGGTEGRYDNSMNLGLLKKKIKLINLTNINAIGQTAESQVGVQLIDLDNPDADKEFQKERKQIVNIDHLPQPPFSNNEEVLNNTVLNSLSLSSKLTENTSVRGHLLYARDRITKQNSSLVQYLTPSSNIEFSETNTLKFKDAIASGEMELKHKSRKNAFIQYRLAYDNTPSHTSNDLLFNRDSIFQKVKNKTYRFHNQVNITKKLADNNLLSIYGYAGKNSLEQTYRTGSGVLEDSSESPLLQNINIPLEYYGVMIDWAGKSDRSEYGIETSFSTDKDQLNAELGMEIADRYDTIDSLSNRTNYKNMALSITGRYIYHFSKYLIASTNLKVTRNSITLNNDRKEMYFVNPRIRLHLKRTPIGNFALTYQYKNKLPEVKYLNENFLLLNYRTFSKGASDIRDIKNHTFSLHYNYNNFKRQFIISSILLYSKVGRNYGVRNRLSENVNLTEYTIMGGGEMINYNLGLTRYLSKISTSVKLSTGHNWNNSPTFINGDLSDLKNYTSFYKFQGTTYFNIPVNAKFYLQYHHTKATFGEQETSNNYMEGAVGITYKISPQWFLELSNTYYFINSEDYLFTHALLNFTPEKSKWSFQLRANNLANHQNYRNVYITEFERNVSSSMVMPRFFLVNAKYRF